MRGTHMIQRERMEKRKKGRGRLAAALAAVLLVCAGTAQTGLASDTASAAFLDVLEDGTVRGGTIHVLPADDMELPDSAVFDLYQIAGAEPIPGQDAYVFKNFAAGESYYTGNIRDAEVLDAAVLNGFAQVLAEAARGSSIQPLMTNVKITDTAENPVTAEAGLYLIILHGEDPDYWDATEEGEIVTCLSEGGSRYAFAPIVVSLPNRTLPEQAAWNSEEYTYGNISIISGAAAGNTADRTAWDYDIEIRAKAGVGDLDGKLRIQKVLPVNETMSNRTDPATFVFRIVAELKGQQVYNDVETIVFDGTNMGAPVTVDIPVGARATVTEIYAGGDYAYGTATAALQDGTAVEYEAAANGVTVEIVPYDEETETDIVTVSFTNTYDDTWKGSGSVENKFEAEADNWKPVVQVYSNAAAVPEQGGAQ